MIRFATLISKEIPIIFVSGFGTSSGYSNQANWTISEKRNAFPWARHSILNAFTSQGNTLRSSAITYTSPISSLWQTSMDCPYIMVYALPNSNLPRSLKRFWELPSRHTLWLRTRAGSKIIKTNLHHFKTDAHNVSSIYFVKCNFETEDEV